MASSFYELLGRLVVLGARLRYGRQIRVAGGVLTVLVGVGGYLLTRRRPPEG
jgi:hypothetical protein